VARSTAYHVQQVTEILQEAILHNGFSVVEIMSQCPTYFGRRNRQGDAVDMLKHMQKITAPIGSRAKEGK
jgi:2-oxoglutarate/2-oxoacid ferredoxin oxidoreductase subunit beta